jgi:acid phosphatase
MTRQDVCRSRVAGKVAFAFLLGATLAACAGPPPDERLHSTLWVQTSAEYAVSTTQVYRMAIDQLESALADPEWVALDYGDDVAGLPGAVIIDVDDTVLDNSGHTARAILSRQGFNQDSWRAWVREAAAPPVPGSVEYLRHAATLGVVVIYLTNRHADYDASTRANLAAIGAPLRPGAYVLMSRRDSPGWTRDKTGRRRMAARRYRVLQVVGDDLADFIQLPEAVDHEQRMQLAEAGEGRWGREWFMLPNPIYGTWEQALMPGGASIFVRPLEQKFRHLETR